MKLSIIILNYKSAGLTLQCVRGILAHPPRELYEVIVVDNTPSEKVLDKLKQFSQIKLITAHKNNGFAAGNNLGIKTAMGEYILILNPDLVVLPGTLDKLISFMNTNSKVGLAGPRLVNPDGSLQYSCFTWPSFWMPLFRRTFLGTFGRGEKNVHKYQMMDWDHQDNRAVDWLLGACLIVRRKALEQVGPLDERYFLYVEDTDWCRRFWAKGWQVFYVSDVEFVHFHERLSAQPSIGKLFKKITWIHIASWCKYFWKWRGIKMFLDLTYPLFLATLTTYVC